MLIVHSSIVLALVIGGLLSGALPTREQPAANQPQPAPRPSRFRRELGATRR